MAIDLDESPALEEAPPLDELMALEPQGLGVELPDDLLIEKKIVGADGRWPVAKTTVKPYSTIATLIISFPKAATPGMCTGSMIAADAVLTAAHCVYNASKGGWASSMRVIPAAYAGADGKTVRPYGSASALRAFAPPEYRNASDFWGREPYDYAVVRVGKGITGLPGVRAYASMAAPTVGMPVTLVGYHGDKCAGATKCQAALSSYIMHISSDTIREVLEADPAPRVFNHYADSKPGASGSPLVSNGAFANTIFAVHVAGLRDMDGATWNMGVLLTPAAVANIKSWVERKV
jgi:putative chitinase